MKKIVFTVGHSTHTIEKFVGLLKAHDVTALADVRSLPNSRYNPQFNQRELREALEPRGVRYVFLGAELGARSKNPECYEKGKVQYDRLAQTELFKLGLKRVMSGCENYRIALMCAEKDPIECHRAILVSRYLKSADLSVKHILSDGGVEDHEETEERILAISGLKRNDLFMTNEQVIDVAYKIQGEAIAYSIPVDDGQDGAQESALA